MKCMHAIVQGRVQGVGFRAATLEAAQELGLGGWVRNRADGTVEVLASGNDDQLSAFEAFLRTGPRLAEVTAVHVTWPEAKPEVRDPHDLRPFHIL